jgi:hypothetical protein
LVGDHILLLNTATARIALSWTAISTLLFQYRILLARQKLSKHKRVNFSHLHVHMQNKFTTTAQPQASRFKRHGCLADWLFFQSAGCQDLEHLQRSFGGDGGGLSFNGRHGMGWNSFSLPAFFIHSLTLFSHYPFHHGR